MVFPNGLTRTVASSNVNELTALNNNLDIIDREFSGLISDSGVANPSVFTPNTGMQWINNDGKWMYYGTSAWSEPRQESFGAWTDFPAWTSPYIARPGFTTQYRISDQKTVEFRGLVQSGTNPDPPPDTGTYIKISGSSIPTTLLPANNREVFTISANGGTSGSNQYVFGQLTILANAGVVEIYLLAQGVHAVGNYYSLDAVRYTAL